MSTQWTFKEHQLSPDERLWLNEAAKRDYTVARAKIRLHGQLTRDFQPAEIDSRLYAFERATVVGLWHVNPEHPVLAALDAVIRNVRTRILEERDLRPVTAEEIASATRHNVNTIERALFTLGDLGRSYFNSARGPAVDGISTVFSEITLSHHGTFDEYLRYQDIDTLLEEFYVMRGSVRHPERTKKSRAVTFANPQQNLALPYAIRKTIDAMFAGTTGFSGPEIVDYFSRLDVNVEQYSRAGGMPSRKLMLQDCLARFPLARQLDILTDMMRPENFRKYSPPSDVDQTALRSWIESQRGGFTPAAPAWSSPISSPAMPVLTQTWDVFISHASEDKETLARPLALALGNRGLKVWFDEFTLTVGDSLRRSIDRGLAHSRFGVVILSESFFQKQWPQLELDGLVARESLGVKVILPVWHRIDAQRVRSCSPMLADRLAVSTDRGLDQVVAALLQAIRSSH